MAIACSAACKFTTARYSIGSIGRSRLRELQLVIEILLKDFVRARQGYRPELLEHLAKGRAKQLDDAQSRFAGATKHTGVAALHGGNECVFDAAAAASQA